jgi:hypothetical protein
MTAKNTVVICCVLALLSFAKCRSQEPALSEQEKGSTLFENCKADLRIADSESKNSALDETGAYRCIGYAQGFADAYAMVSPARFCAEGASIGTIIRIYVNFMQQNPKYLDSYRGIGFLEAMKASYPCAKQ